MSWIIAENVSHAYGPLEVLKDISFRVAESDRIGLVGPNGEGKTTLLRIVGGLLDSTGGQVHRARSLRIGYLPQIPPDLGAGSLHETMLNVFRRLRQMERALHQISGDLEKHCSDPERLGRY